MSVRFGVVGTMSLCVAAFAVFSAGHASAGETRGLGGSTSPVITTGPILDVPITAPVIAVGCASPGGSQDVAKTPVLKNTASVALAKGTTITWKSSDGDSGKVVLAADLAVGATVKAQGTKAGNGYTCSANYVARPDLKVKKVWLSGPMQATVELANLDPYADAPASKIRLDIGLCNTNMTQTLESSPVAVGKGQTKLVTFDYPAMFGTTRYQAWADIGDSVKESFEQNNVWYDYNLCH